MATARFTSLLLALVLAISPAGALRRLEGKAGPESPLRVLFIGNSLTTYNDLPGMTAALARAGEGRTLVAESVARPGYGLEDHWTSKATRDALGRGDWDVVVLQQGPSATEGRPSLLEYSVKFADEARRIGAQIAIYMVWPSRARSGDFDGVSDSHRAAAERTGGILLPAGEAWRLAWAADPELALYGRDGFHPSRAGSYLAALVIVQGLAGIRPQGLPGRLTLPSGDAVDLDERTAAVLQAAAAEANRRFARRGAAPPGED